MASNNSQFMKFEIYKYQWEKRKGEPETSICIRNKWYRDLKREISAAHKNNIGLSKTSLFDLGEGKTIAKWWIQQIQLTKEYNKPGTNEYISNKNSFTSHRIEQK